MRGPGHSRHEPSKLSRSGEQGRGTSVKGPAGQVQGDLWLLGDSPLVQKLTLSMEVSPGGGLPQREKAAIAVLAQDPSLLSSQTKCPSAPGQPSLRKI